MCHALKREKWGPRINQKVSSAGENCRAKRKIPNSWGFVFFTRLVFPAPAPAVFGWGRTSPAGSGDTARFLAAKARGALSPPGGLRDAAQEPERALTYAINKTPCPYRRAATLIKAITQPPHVPTLSYEFTISPDVGQ